MEVLSLEQIAVHVSRGHFGRARLPIPRYGPMQWYTAARKILGETEFDPVATPEEIAEAEGMVLEWFNGTMTCGMSLGRLLICAPSKTACGRWIGFTHERVHVHSRSVLVGGNEADIWGTTIETMLPRWLPMNTVAAIALHHAIPRTILDRQLSPAVLRCEPDNDGAEDLTRAIIRNYR